MEPQKQEETADDVVTNENGTPSSPEVHTVACNTVDIDSHARHGLRQRQFSIGHEPLMGPLLRRKRVVSMPLGAGGDFFTSMAVNRPSSLREKQNSTGSHCHPRRIRQPTPPTTTSIVRSPLQGQDSFLKGVVRRKQVSLNLLGPNDFFAVSISETEEDAAILPCSKEDDVMVDDNLHAIDEKQQETDALSEGPKLFFPLRFAPRAIAPGGGIPHGGVDGQSGVLVEGDAVEGESTIIRATKGDKIKTGILFGLMLAITLAFTLWETHLGEEVFIHGPIGRACVTPCVGDVTVRDFFVGHHHFERGQIIELIMHLDPNPVAENAQVLVQVVGTESGVTKAAREFGPVDGELRLPFHSKITVDFDVPEEDHIIVVNSTIPEHNLSFTLLADVQTHLSKSSVVVAAIIMVAVYFFILIEVIHRMLVAIFGSMIALMFYFIMQDGETESIRQIMLHLEWSTLGLLFGMMLMVGELSHTGIFEWFAVRVLVASKGSFVRLLVLLCSLTAVASAFLDNVTTMLLIAPVTIDMCKILDVDPRPYLISEVILSNIGGTATLIGDPPNILIGAALRDVGFVDFIINVLPCIILFCVPASLAMVTFLYRPYLAFSKMRDLETELLKRTYPIHDEPRLMIAGTVTGFVILLFFLHPVHHKDTAWVALLGAFITMSATNPHNVQDALRNHVEWDTLLFFAGLFVLVEVCAAMGLLATIGDALAAYIESQDEDRQLGVAITLLLWVSAITSAFLDNIPYTATMIPVIKILADTLPDTLPLTTLAWALSFGACLGGNGTLLGASANIVTAGIATNKGYDISFVNFMYPGIVVMVLTVAIANLYMMVVYVWI